MKFIRYLKRILLLSIWNWRKKSEIGIIYFVLASNAIYCRRSFMFMSYEKSFISISENELSICNTTTCIHVEIFFKE